jgi:hypothetical protein
MREFVIVVEAEADARQVCSLANRIFQEGTPQQVDENSPPTLPNWSGLEPSTPFTKWTEIKELALRYNMPRYRRRTSEPQGSYYAQSQKVVWLVDRLRMARIIDALILACDLDNEHDQRRTSLKQTKYEAQARLIVVLATPNPKREAWVLNGFICAGRHEERELASLRRKLKFDPCLEAHRLRYASRTSLTDRDPKGIVRRLTGGNWEREQQCWDQTDLSILHERGTETYLTEFLDEVKDRLLPLIAGHTQS